MAKKNLIVGLFALAALALFSTGLFLIGDRNEAFSRHMDFYAEFTNLSGLSKGSKVQVAGMNAGQVIAIAIPDSPSSKFRVKIQIDEKLHGLVRTDSVAAIGTEGVVGDTFLQISPGSSKLSAAQPLSTLASKEPTEISAILDQAKGTLTNVDLAVKNADGLITSAGGNLNALLLGANRTISNANDVVVGVKQGRGSVGMLLRDQAVSSQVRDVVGNAQQASHSLSDASRQADALVTDIKARNFPQQIDDSLAKVKDTATNVDASSKQLRQTVADFTGPDQQGVTAGINLRDTLTNTNAATANLADDTEALKHNFLLKSFFRHRGYYNLAHIDPEKYRTDKLFANSANRRVWLPVNQLFQADPNGIDRLTKAGEAILDQMLVGFGDTIFETPIVVEGYSDIAAPEERLAIARHRALLVRDYLLNHFQLNAGNLGAVAMGERPPSSLGHSAWDGISIVMLRQRP